MILLIIRQFITKLLSQIQSQTHIVIYRTYFISCMWHVITNFATHLQLNLSIYLYQMVSPWLSCFSSAYHNINICKWHILLTTLNVKNRNNKRLKTLDIIFMLLLFVNQCTPMKPIRKRIDLFVTNGIILRCTIYHIGMMREKRIWWFILVMDFDTFW